MRNMLFAKMLRKMSFENNKSDSPSVHSERLSFWLKLELIVSCVAPAAVLVLLAGAARARIVPAHLRHIASYGLLLAGLIGLRRG